MNENSHAPYAELVDVLVKRWRDLSIMYSRPGSKGKQVIFPQRAYLLFNRWDENPLAQELVEQFSQWARDRVAVPDSYFENRVERAPFLVELPEELVVSTAGFQTRALCDWLAHCLEITAKQVNERTSRQDFCGIVISPASAQTITRYWVNLGNQQSPHQDERVLFRYHDPRVMQRVWAALNPSQQTKWLGPVTHWWSLVQPWGPFNGPREAVQWFQAKHPVLPQDVQAGGSPHDLFDEEQWDLTEISPLANRLWRSYAKHNIPAQAQPDAYSLLQMLADAARMKLEGLNLEDYVWITWMHEPKDGVPRLRDWTQPHVAPMLNRIEAQLRAQPEMRFSTLFSQAIQQS